MRFITRPLNEFTEHSVDLNDVAGDDGVLFDAKLAGEQASHG